MKLSISVPDDLWAQAAPADSSPSEIVQQALSEMVSRRKPKSPWGRAPDMGVVEEYKETLDAAVQRLLSERMRVRRDGYRVGAKLAADASLGVDWFIASVARLEPETLRLYLKDMLEQEDVGGADDDFRKLVLSLAWEEAQVKPELVYLDEDHEGPVLPQEFLAGIVDALCDIWDMVETESGVKEA